LKRRRSGGPGALAARAEWPFVWDCDGRDDHAVGAALAPDGDLLVLVEAWAQGQGSPHGVLLRIDPAGTLVAEPVDPELRPTALALAPDGRALALGRAAGGIRVTAYDG
jgi:hypothetical protein